MSATSGIVPDVEDLEQPRPTADPLAQRPDELVGPEIERDAQPTLEHSGVAERGEGVCFGRDVRAIGEESQALEIGPQAHGRVGLPSGTGRRNSSAPNSGSAGATTTRSAVARRSQCRQHDREHE